jgi:cytochrome c-type biogenesis protein CcmH
VTLLWAAIAALTIVAVVPIVRALLGTGPAAGGADRSALLVAQLKAQLADVDRELERGLIEPAEADGLRIEIKRRMLNAAGDDGEAPSPAPLSAPPRSSLLAGGLAAAVTVGAVAIYVVLGTPAAPDQPLAARRAGGDLAAVPAAEDADAAERLAFREALAALEARLREHPEDTRGWTLLGGAYRSERRYADAARAFGEAYRRTDNDPALASDLAETLIASADGRITPEIRTLLEQALAFDPRDARARFFLALAQAQAGDLAAALQGWVDLLLLVPADAPFVPVVREHVSRAAALLGVDASSITPSPEARALAAISPEEHTQQQAAMVRQMVDRLADRLAREPGDRDGWLKLARAYDVLGEPQRAAEARARAAALDGRGAPSAAQ